jgi:hypothetical protein
MTFDFFFRLKCHEKYQKEIMEISCIKIFFSNYKLEECFLIHLLYYIFWRVTRELVLWRASLDSKHMLECKSTLKGLLLLVLIKY